jgi:hypothetical protein
MGRVQKIMLLAGAAALATAAVAQPAKKAPAKPAAAKPAAAAAASGSVKQVVTGPVAIYWMSAATQSGFGMPGAGGGRPSAMDMMKMMQGGGGANHMLTLQLGSSESPTGAPQAEHDPPSALGVGMSVPLVSPEKAQPVVHEETERTEIPREYQKPKGKMMIFWGCGEHAKPGQPVVIDFSQLAPDKLAAGQMPAGFEAFSHMITSRMQPPSPSRNKTYGDWPNSKSRVSVNGQSSLVGDHVVKGDYSPEMRFNLDQTQDFLGPLTLTTNAKTPSGSVQLGWNAVPNAEGYLASFIGAGGGGGRGEDPTIVMWISSETEAIGFAMPDYISNPEAARLVKAQTLMGPDTTTCQVPKEAVEAGKQGLVQMVAYGHEANIAYPERPKDPKVPWNIAWEVKVRYRSATGGLLGQAMPGMGGGGSRTAQGGQSGQPAQQPSPQDAAAARRRAILNGIGGLIPH